LIARKKAHKINPVLGLAHNPTSPMNESLMKAAYSVSTKFLGYLSHSSFDPDSHSSKKKTCR
jgi:hypothetical protein